MSAATDRAGVVEDWIALLLEADCSGLPLKRHPAQLDCTLPQAYAAQAIHLQRLLARKGGKVIGRKLSVTTEVAQARLGLRAPLLGPILGARSHASGAVLERAGFLACILEAEIGVRLCADLDGSTGMPSRATVLAAIGGFMPAIEIADSRYAEWAEAPACAIVADLAYAGAWVRGEEVAPPDAPDLVAVAVSLSCDGKVIRHGSGAQVLGDPLQALALAAVNAASRGEVLRAGEVISTGACTAPWPARGGGRFEADFGPLGHVELTLR